MAYRHVAIGWLLSQVGTAGILTPRYLQVRNITQNATVSVQQNYVFNRIQTRDHMSRMLGETSLSALIRYLT